MALRFVEEDEISVAERKKKLRAYMKERRANNENRDVKEGLLLQHFLALYQAIFGESIGAGTRRTFFVYLSFSSEAPTDKLIQKLIEHGHTVCAPRVVSGEMQAVQIVEDETDFDYSPFGSVEPIGEEYQGAIDVAVIPLLAVDAKGNRLGYGGGYYDRFLQKYPQIKRVGYAFDFQILPLVPTTQQDEKVKYIVTDKRTVIINE